MLEIVPWTASSNPTSHTGGLNDHGFALRPWTTPVAETDVRPGGASLIARRRPDRKEFPGRVAGL
jgi:hypothetical protein